MGKLRKLQERYLKGELTKAQYEAECKKLLDDEILDQDAYDDALDYDPDYERPKYSQADVDSTVAKKAVKMVRKALKDAEVTVEADDKTLLSKVAETIKNGSSGKGDGEGGSGSSIDETELSNLKTKAAKVDDLTAQCKKLLIENAVLKEAGKYNPVNPAQVVRAISADYLDSIEFDEENGTADAKSIARAIRKVHDAEPNLFKPAGDDGDDGNGAGGSGNGFRGKGPGGAGSTKNGELEAKKAEALEMLGIKKDDKK